MNDSLVAPLPAFLRPGGWRGAAGRLPQRATVLFFALLVAALAGACLSWWRAESLGRQQREYLLASLDRGATGGSVFRLLGNPRDRAKVAWLPLTRGPLDFPRGPLPGKTDYRAAALAGFFLPAAGRVLLRTAADDGLVVRIDGKTVYAAPGRHALLKAETGFLLGPGPHILEAEYTQNEGDACWFTGLVGPGGRAIRLFPPRAGFNAAQWQHLKRRQYIHEQLKFIGLAAGAGLLGLWFLYAALGWWGRLAPALADLKAEATALWAGLGLGFVSQAVYLLNNQDNWAWARLTLAPAGLAVVLAGAVRAAKAFPRFWAGLCRAGGAGAAWVAARERWLAPTAAWAACAGFWGLWARALEVNWGEVLLTPRWDAVWYRLIMARGYFVVFHDGGEITGNHAWFPLFPLLARATRLFGLDFTPGLLATGWAASLAAFFLLYHLAKRLWGVGAARWAVAGLACYPCSFYLFLGFPYGTCLALSLGFFWALWQRRYYLAALLGFFMSLSYTIGAVGGVAALALIFSRLWRGEDKWREFRGLFVTCFAVLAGVLALCLHHWAVFGDFWLAFSSHADWGRRPEWPWLAIARGAASLAVLDPVMAPIVLVVLALAVFGHRFLPALWWLLLVTFLLPPSTGFLGSNFRQYLMLWPLFLLVASSPRGPFCKLAFLAAMLWLGVGLYLPLLLAGRLA